MTWLTQNLPGQSILWLLISTAVALASGFLSSWLYYRTIKRQEIVDTAAVRKEIEEYLGDRSAEREYRLEARKRLYTAVGPLRFQLLLACRDLASRVEKHGLRQPYKLERGGYYFETTLFRILRPLAIAELIERQVAFADFSVDREMIDLLRFKKAARKALSGGRILLNHPGTDWENQTEHLFSGNLDRAANNLIITDANGRQRVSTLAEFRQFLAAPGNLARLSPLDSILIGFRTSTKPLFWLRLVALGSLCTQILKSQGRDIGFETQEFPVAQLLTVSGDQYILDNLSAYADAVRNRPRTAS
jgi:hypothetical protein